MFLNTSRHKNVGKFGETERRRHGNLKMRICVCGKPGPPLRLEGKNKLWRCYQSPEVSAIWRCVRLLTGWNGHCPRHCRCCWNCWRLLEPSAAVRCHRHCQKLFSHFKRDSLPHLIQFFASASHGQHLTGLAGKGVWEMQVTGLQPPPTDQCGEWQEWHLAPPSQWGP